MNVLYHVGNGCISCGWQELIKAMPVMILLKSVYVVSPLSNLGLFKNEKVLC